MWIYTTTKRHLYSLEHNATDEIKLHSMLHRCFRNTILIMQEEIVRSASFWLVIDLSVHGFLP